MLSATIAQAAVITIPAMNPTLGRPGTRPSITALGSNTGTGGVGSVMCGSILCGPRARRARGRCHIGLDRMSLVV